MNGYEKIAKVMDSIAQSNKGTSIQIGTYSGGGIVTTDMTIPATMIVKLVCCNKFATKVDGIVSENSFTDASTYIELKEGDAIAFQQMNASKFLILGKIE